MTAVQIDPGDVVTFDPLDVRGLLFDYDTLNLEPGAAIASYTITITPKKQNGAGALTYDADHLLVGHRQLYARFDATAAALGDRYTLAVQAVTDEAPPQTKNYSVDVVIQKR